MKKVLNVIPCFLLALVFAVSGCGEKVPPPQNTVKSDAADAVMIAGDKEIPLPCSVAYPASGVEAVLISAPGFMPEWLWLSPPENGKANEYFVEMRKITAPVIIESNPAGAQISVDGGDTGMLTPASLLLEYGEHTVSLTKKGCDPVKVPFLINSSVPRKEIVNVANQLGELRVQTIPTGAEIFLDGEKIGVSDYSGYQMEGVYDLRIALSGCGEYTAKIGITRDKTTEIGPIDLQNLPGILKITCSEAGAEVFVDGKSVGKTPMDGITLAPGSHEIAVKKEGFADYTGSCRIYPEKTETKNIELLNYYGSVEFYAVPADAQVFFNSVYIGTAGEEPILIEKLESGIHQVDLYHENIIPSETYATYFIELQQGESLVIPEPLVAPVANVELIMANNLPWRGRVELPVDENVSSIMFEPMEGGKVTLALDTIREIRLLKP